MQKSCKPNAMKLASIAEVQLILCKDCANRTQNDKLAWSLCWDAANLMQRLCKSRAESSSLLECYAEPPPILCKVCANRTQNNEFAWLLCWDAAKLMQRYIFSPTPPSISQILRYILPLMINFILPQIPPMDTDLFLRTIVLSQGKQSSPPYHTHFKILTNHFSSP